MAGYEADRDGPFTVPQHGETRHPRPRASWVYPEGSAIQEKRLIHIQPVFCELRIITVKIQYSPAKEELRPFHEPRGRP